jgi:hypothetical protein
MKKRGNASRMKKITTAAKKIRKNHPNMKWTTAIKQGAKKVCK